MREPLNRLKPVVCGLTVVAVAFGSAALNQAVRAPERVESQVKVIVPTTVFQALTATVTTRETTVVEVPPTETVVATVTETIEVPSTRTPAEELAPSEPAALEGDWPDDGAVWSWRPGLEAEYGLWAGTLLDGSEVHVDPLTPEWMLPLVRLHEHGHVLQARRYGRVDAAPNYEQMADCMAVLQGWTDELRYGCPERLMPLAKEVLG